MAHDAGTQIKEWLRRTDFPGCIALLSPDRVRRTRAQHYICDELQRRTKFRLDICNCSDLTLESLSQLAASFKTLSLFTESKIVILTHLSLIKKELVVPLQKMIASADSRNIILLVDALPEKKGALTSLLEDSSIPSAQFPALEGPLLAEWIQKEVKRLGLNPLPSDVLLELSLSTDNDLDEIVSRLDRLSLFSDTPTITIATYRELYPLKVLGNDYKFVETLVTGDRKQSERLATLSLLEQSQPLGLLALINKTVSQVIQLKQPARGNKPALPPWLAQKYQKMAQQISPAVAQRAFISLATADFRLKDKNLGPLQVFSKLAQLFQAK